jgi:hypothetical protein
MWLCAPVLLVARFFQNCLLFSNVVPGKSSIASALVAHRRKVRGRDATAVP